MSFLKFAEAIRQRESSDNYKCVNKFGFVGAYQFGKMRLYDLDISLDGYAPPKMDKRRVLSREEFLNDTKLQDELFRKHCQLHRAYILKHLQTYIGSQFNYKTERKTITVSGMIAGAHLKGLGGLVNFCLGKDSKDALGTTVGDYMVKFGGYDLSDLEDLT